MKTILARVRCFFGRHDWLYDHPNCNHGRVCRKCSIRQQYTLVDFGRSKEWITFEDKR